MSQPYVGEIRMFGGNFSPAGWEFCSGQLLPISENEALFSLIGTTYGGDGQSTYGLPNLQSRVPIHIGTASSGTSYQLAESGGVEQVTLTTPQMPVHSHPFFASTNLATAPSPQSNVMGQSSTMSWYRAGAVPAQLAATTLQAAGGSQPHDNMIPYLCINYIISMFGIFPTQT